MKVIRDNKETMFEVPPDPGGTTICVIHHSADEPSVGLLRRHLSLLDGAHPIVTCDETSFSPDNALEGYTAKMVESAGVVVILLSVHFISEPVLSKTRFPALAKDRFRRRVHLVPVILRPCDWRAASWLAGKQPWPEDGDAIITAREPDLDAHFARLSGYVRALLQERRARFEEFFGRRGEKAPATLVFPHRRGAGSAFKYPHLQKRVKLLPSVPNPGDVACWFAYEDLRAAGYIASTFGNVVNEFLRYAPDGQIGEGNWDTTSTIAIGLGFTGHTHRLIQKGSFGDRFSLSFRKVERIVHNERKIFTEDTLTLFEEPQEAENSRNIRQHVAVIVRLAPTKTRHVHFICGGRSAPGTAAAGYCLATQWERLFGLFHKNGANPVSDHLIVQIRRPVRTRRPDGAEELMSFSEQLLDSQAKLLRASFVNPDKEYVAFDIV